MRRIALGMACTVLTAAATTALAQQTASNYAPSGATPLSQYGPQQPGYISPSPYTGRQTVAPMSNGMPGAGPQQAVYQQPVYPNQPQPAAAQSIYHQSHLQPRVVYPASYGGLFAPTGPVLQVNPKTGRQEIRPNGPLPPSSKPHANPYFMGRSDPGSFVMPVGTAMPGQSVSYEDRAEAAAAPREHTWQEDLKEFFWPF